jgi:hypothetical protein
VTARGPALAKFLRTIPLMGAAGALFALTRPITATTTIATDIMRIFIFL